MIAKLKIPNIFLLCGCALLAVQSAFAQFYTITEGSVFEDVKLVEEAYCAQNNDSGERFSYRSKTNHQSANGTEEIVKKPVYAHHVSNITFHQSCSKENEVLLELTIPNLLAEIKRNNIKYPKIVLAQAILETGWFKSSVCRSKHNLFGLTNPRTGSYYEFNHWTESVRAYYTKVQYRYKGGNYLLWLRKIGYAEDPGYIRALIRVLKQL